MDGALSDGPLTSDELRLSLDELGVPLSAPLAVAVSGGADSLCLAMLLKETRPVTALIVDHGLRSRSSDEAQLTADRLTALKIECKVLEWRHDQMPAANIQAAAREARYGLMSKWCNDHQIQFLCTAHHMDDQAETLMLRMARGSGVYGLAGMAGTRELGQGVTLVRPLLAYPKSRLVATLEAQKLDWVEDPSNQSEKFDRVKIRNLLADPPLEGFRADRLAATAQRMRRSREALEFYQRQWLSIAAEFFDAGYALLDKSKFNDVPEDIYLRALNSVIQFSGGGDYAPRFEKLIRLAGAIISDDFKGHTLSGVKFAPFADDRILVTREISAMEPEKAINKETHWDGRFVAEATKNMQKHNLLIGPLGDAGREFIMDSIADLEESALMVPKQVLPTLPAIFEGERLIAVPHVGYKADERKIPILSHQWLTSSEIGKKSYRGMQ